MGSIRISKTVVSSSHGSLAPPQSQIGDCSKKHQSYQISLLKASTSSRQELFKNDDQCLDFELALRKWFYKKTPKRSFFYFLSSPFLAGINQHQMFCFDCKMHFSMSNQRFPCIQCEMLDELFLSNKEVIKVILFCHSIEN